MKDIILYYIRILYYIILYKNHIFCTKKLLNHLQYKIIYFRKYFNLNFVKFII